MQALMQDKFNEIWASASKTGKGQASNAKDALEKWLTDYIKEKQAEIDKAVENAIKAAQEKGSLKGKEEIEGFKGAVEQATQSTGQLEGQTQKAADAAKKYGEMEAEVTHNLDEHSNMANNAGAKLDTLTAKIDEQNMR